MIHLAIVLGSTAALYLFLSRSMKLPQDQTILVIAVAELVARVLGV